MKILNKLIKFSLLTSLAILCFFAHSVPSQASAFPGEGTYRGLIKTKNGDQIPLRFDLSYSDALEKAPDDDLFPMKRAITASVYVDNEGGPYGLGQASFNLETGKLELAYTRPVQSGPTLKFQGSLVSDTRIKGHVVSGLRGDLGTFDVSKDSKVGLLEHTVYAGEYLGKLRYSATGQILPIKIKLTSNTLTSQNPSNLEFDFTPGYAGIAILNTWPAVIQTVSIDYFTHTIFLTHRENEGTSLTLVGKMTPNGIEGGYMTSSIQGRTADFTAERIK